MKYKATKEEYQAAVQNAKSLAGVARNLGIFAGGGNYATIKRNIAKYELDTSHFTGQAWNRENWSAKPNHKVSIKLKLIRERGHQCQGDGCGITEWLKQPVPLELEHIDGNSSNNDYSNLLLLCPNCHALTPTWRRAKLSAIRNGRLCTECENEVRSDQYTMCYKCRRKLYGHSATQKLEPKFCACGKELGKNNTKGVCLNCPHVAQHRIVWPSAEELRERLKSTSFVQLGRELGVSDNAIRKFLRNNS